MNHHKTDVLAMVLRLLVFLGLLLGLHGCNGCTPCCPKILNFTSNRQWLCADCPDAQALLFFTVVYEKEGAPCDLSGGLIGLKVKDGKGLNPSYIVKNPSKPGLYENKPGGVPVRAGRNFELPKTSTITLTATGDDGCPAATQDIEIKVVESKSREKLCFPHNDLPPAQGLWTGTSDIFSVGVAVDYVENPNPFVIQVTHAGPTVKIAPSTDPNPKTFGFKDLPANGKWSIQIPDPGDYQKFLASGKELCVIVGLKCICP
jgi:hypothetical protein